MHYHQRVVLSSEAVPFTPTGMERLGICPPPSPATLHRWRLRGRLGHRLSTFLRGGRRYVTPTAVAEFFEAITAAADLCNEAPAATQGDREKAILAAERELEN